MSRLRLPARVARREVWRRPGRTALVVLLVAIPVAGMVLAAVVVRSDRESPQEEWERQFGQADALTWSGGPPVELPSGTRRVEVTKSFGRLKTADGRRTRADLTDLPLTDPLASGIYDLAAGRAPGRGGEVALSSQLADQLDAHPGDELRLERPSLVLSVVGEVEPVGCLSCDTIVFPPGGLPALDTSAGFTPSSTITLFDLPDHLSDTDLEVLAVATRGALEVRGHLPPDPFDDGSRAVRWSLVLGAVVLTVAGIVISAAFAVGARRQLVTLGQLAASGASPATVRTALVLQGAVTGLIGVVVGGALAATILILGEGRIELLLDRRLDGYEVRPLDLVAAAGLGLGAATLAALLPARSAARVPTLAALAGRRPIAPVSRRLVAVGMASVMGGLALMFLAVLGAQQGNESGDVWVLVAIVGAVAELLGACAVAPALVARLEPLAARLRGSLRIGARSLARNRARTGAVVSAVAAAGALAVTAGALFLGNETRSVDQAQVPDDLVVVSTYAWGQGEPIDTDVPPAVRAELADALPEAVEIPLTAAVFPAADSPDLQGYWEVVPAAPTAIQVAMGFPSVGGERAIVATPDVLGALRAGDAIRKSLDEVGVVALTSPSSQGLQGDALLVVSDGRQVPAVAIRHRYSAAYLTPVLVSQTKAAELGMEVQPIGFLYRTADRLTSSERGALEDLQFDLEDVGSVAASTEGDGVITSPEANVLTQLDWQHPRTGPTPLQLELMLTGVALVFSLFVVGVSLALVAAESRDERDILTIAGAPPGTLARSAGARAWLLAVIGAGMAIPVGFLPVVVFSWASDRNEFGLEGFPIVFPTRTVLLLLGAVPVVVALASWAGSATAQRLRPVRVSTATFE